MKKCTKCARTYSGGERFCSNCGIALSETTAEAHGVIDSGQAVPFDPLRARIRIVLMVALLNVVAFVAFGGGVLWLTFDTVGTTLHDEVINQMLILTDGMGTRAAKSLQAGDTDMLRQLLKETKANPDIVYIFIRSAEGRIVASTFEGDAVPDDLRNINEVSKGVPFATQETRFVSGGMALNIVDVATGIAEGSQGSIHVGWNTDIQRRGIRQLFLRIGVFAVALLIVSVGILVALVSALTSRILTSPARKKA